MNNQRLQYYMHDDTDALRFELAGRLSGAGAHNVDQARQTALSILGERPLIIDITFVVDADERGRAMLGVWHRSGARIIAASRESRALAQSVLGEAAIAPGPKQSWLARMRSALFGGKSETEH